MFSHETKIRVRYAETDKMGYVYYGHYATYYEIGRVETFRKLGLSYKKLEESGVMMPVLDLKIKFIKPAKYDDLLIIRTVIRKLPTVRIHFEYEIFSLSSFQDKSGREEGSDEHSPLLIPPSVPPVPIQLGMQSGKGGQKRLLNVGETTLVFVNLRNGKPCKPPQYFIEKIKPYFQTSNIKNFTKTKNITLKMV